MFKFRPTTIHVVPFLYYLELIGLKATREGLTGSLVPARELPARPLTAVGLAVAKVASEAIFGMKCVDFNILTNNNYFDSYLAPNLINSRLNFLIVLIGCWTTTWEFHFIVRDMGGATWILVG